MLLEEETINLFNYEEVLSRPEVEEEDRWKDTLTPRYYQQEAMDGADRVYSSGKRGALLVMATGTGKSLTGSMIGREFVKKGGRVLWIAHREELIHQAIRELRSVGLRVSLEKADNYSRNRNGLEEVDVVVTTPQTMKGDRMKSFDPDTFSLIIVDEAHRGVAKSYTSIYDHFASAKLLGLTATATRLDGINLGTVFDEVAYSFGIVRAIEEGFLVNIVRNRLSLDPPVDLRGLNLREVCDDSEEVRRRIREGLGSIVNTIRQSRYEKYGLGNRYAISFVRDVGTAEAMAAALRSIGITAEFVSGYCKDRSQKIRRFKEGEYQVLVNANLLIEGADFPFVSCVMLLAPTTSWGRVAQMIGRGTRKPKKDCTLDPEKTDCVVLDFAWLLDDHDLTGQIVQLFDDGSLSKREAELASKFMDEGETSAEVAIDLAKEEAKREKEEEERKHQEELKRIEQMRLEIEKRETRYVSKIENPMDVGEVLGIKIKGRQNGEQAAPSWLVSKLNNFRVPGAERMSYREGMTLYKQLDSNLKSGVATYRQINYLVMLGMPRSEASKVKFRDVNKTIEMLRNKKSGGGEA